MPLSAQTRRLLTLALADVAAAPALADAIDGIEAAAAAAGTAAGAAQADATAALTAVRASLPCYGDGHHGAVEFIDNIFVLTSPIEATTIVIDSSWLKAANGGPNGLVLRATESITIRGGCYFTGMGNNGEDANGITPGGLNPGYQGLGAGGARNGSAGGAVTEGAGEPGVSQHDVSNMGGWSSPGNPFPNWNEAQPQPGGNGGTTGLGDNPVSGGQAEGQCLPIDIMDWLMGRGSNGIPLGAGGCGGAGGNCDGIGVAGAGAQGGGGGSPVLMAAPRIIYEAGAAIERDVTGGSGGRGGDAVGGNCGGGGGGAAGNCSGIFDLTESLEVGAEVSVTDRYYPYESRAQGGANGNGSGDTGTTGASGSNGLSGRTYLINPITMQFTNRD